jgi:hypothetical protein
MVLDGRNAPTQAIGMANCPNSVNPKTYCHGNTEPSTNLYRFEACVENVQAASIWKKISSELRGNLQNQPEMRWSPVRVVTFLIISTIVGIIGFALMVGFIASMNTSGMTAMDILVLGFIPTLFLIAILYGSDTMPLYEAIRKVHFPNSVNAKAQDAMPIPSQA